MNMLDQFLLRLSAENVSPEEFWRKFYDVSQREQEEILDVLKETSINYQTNLSNEALRQT